MTADIQLLREISLDRSLGSAILFPHRHEHETAPMHVEIMDLWASAEENVIIEAFREGGKTTIAEEFLVMAGGFGNFNYCLLIGETYDKACDRLAEIDKEARTNERIQKLFGGRILARKSNEDRVWFRAPGGRTRLIQALGWDQELQSFKHEGFRPDYAFFDDPENRDRVRSKEAVDESMHKLYLELIPAMDAHRCRIRFSQTRRAEDCMVTRLMNSKSWLYRGWPICNGDPDDPDTTSNWPGRYPMEWVRTKKADFQAEGMLSEFNQAYMLEASNPEAKHFKREMLRVLDAAPWQFMPKYAIYDPSRSTNQKRTKEAEKSDRTGKIVVSRMGSSIIIHESGGFYWKPDALIDDMFVTQEKHECAKMGIEKNSLDEWLLQPIRLAIMRRGAPLPLKPLQAPQDRSKEDFIMGLYPFAQARDVVLVGGIGAHAQLVAEWENFPKGPRDIMNALAYSLRMFAGTPMYEDFSQQNIGDAPTARRGEDVFVAVHADPTQAVAVAVLREGRRLHVARDWSVAGALADAVKTLVFEIRTAFPTAALQVWTPAETFDQWQRIAVVPALRQQKLTPMRAEHVAVARGGLAERLRMKWHGKPMLMVDLAAKLTCNALGAGYALPTDKGGRAATMPEEGISRLVGEALETMVAMLDRLGDAASNGPANVAVNPQGKQYVTALPGRG